MIRRLIVAAFGLFLSVAALGADAAPGIAEGEVLRGRFTQERQLQGFAAPLRSEGRFLLAPGRGLIWKTEKPFSVVTVITEAGLVQEVNGNQTLRMTAAKLPFLSRLYHMLGGALAGDWHRLEGDFTVTQEGNDAAWHLDLLPKTTDDVTMPFRSIGVTGGRFVDQVILTKPDGDLDKLTFVDQVLSAAPLSADEALALDLANR